MRRRCSAPSRFHRRIFEARAANYVYIVATKSQRGRSWKTAAVWDGRSVIFAFNSRSRTLCTASSCARTRQIRGRERWVVLVVDIISYAHRCADHGIPRRTSALALSASAFFIIFFSKYARANSTGRDAAEVHSV